MEIPKVSASIGRGEEGPAAGLAAGRICAASVCRRKRVCNSQLYSAIDIFDIDRRNISGQIENEKTCLLWLVGKMGDQR